MKKRILSVVCALAIAAGMIIPWTGDVHAAETTKCPMCSATNVTWESLETWEMVDGHHYRLTRDQDMVKPIELVAVTGAKRNFCLDLAGYAMHGPHRAFIIRDGNTLNIMDSSAQKTGTIDGTGIGGGAGGGIVYLYTGATVNFYSGTIAAVGDAQYTADNGGTVRVAGATFNMYGGNILGGRVDDFGGAVSVTSGATLNMQGGSIVGGTADNKGNCVYAASGAKVILSKNGNIEELYFDSASTAASGLQINGRYSGRTQLQFGTAPADGNKIGTCTNAVVEQNLSIKAPRLYGTVSGTNLLASKLTGVSVKAKGGSVTYYSSLAEAVVGMKAESTIKLLADNNENVTIPVNATLDLFGWDLTGNITAAGTLKLKDSATDDMITTDTEGYGYVTGTITGDVQPAPNYAPISDANGTSYHKYVLQLTKVSLRPGDVGIYYTADIKMDDVMQEKLDQFGIAVSTANENPDLKDPTTKYTAFDKTAYGSSTAKSALISAVMETKNAPDQNAVYASTNVYGRPYIQYTDADGQQSLYGYAYGTNLQALTEQIAGNGVEKLRLIQNKAISDMYETYQDALQSWNVPALKTAAAKKKTASEDKVLKVLAIGNSHAEDSVLLLREVFNAEGFGEYDDVILGYMYIGGCTVSQHAKNVLENLPYTWYEKNENGSWHKYTADANPEKTTLQYALQDEDWDVVLLQEMNRVSAYPDTDTEGNFAFGNDNIEIVYNYVAQQLGYVPELMWNMIWANPEIPEDYLKKVMEEEAGGNDYDDPDHGGGDTAPTGGSTDSELDMAYKTWIFGGGSNILGSRISWSQNYATYWSNDRQIMYEHMVTNVEDYVIGNSYLPITEDDVMPAATAVQYALEYCGVTENGSAHMGDTPTGIYRDYTHMGDFGRVLVAYLWHAKLTGKTEITEVKYTTVPVALRQSRFSGHGDLVLDKVHINAIKASVNHALKNPLECPRVGS